MQLSLESNTIHDAPLHTLTTEIKKSLRKANTRTHKSEMLKRFASLAQRQRINVIAGHVPPSLSALMTTTRWMTSASVGPLPGQQGVNAPTVSSSNNAATPPAGGGGGTSEANAVADACSILSVRSDLPLGNLLQLLSPASRSAIFKSGKGVEGFFRLYSGQDLELASKDGIVTIRSLRPHPGGAQTSLAASSALKQPAPELTSEQNKELCSKINALLPEGKYTAFVEVYNKLYETPAAREAVKVEDFIFFVKNRPQAYWVHKRSFCKRSPGETSQPVFAGSEGLVSPLLSPVPHSNNNFGGWGAASNVPTAADVFEILKYIPVHWGNMGNLNVPQEVKKKHARIASFLQWLRRQPRYFELRNIAGTIEVRRAVVLHPEQHGMTAEEAEKWLDERIRSGMHNSVAAAPPTAAESGASAPVGALSSAALALHKFLVRVCPGYFVPASLVLARYVKKTLTAAEIDQCAKDSPHLFELLVMSNGVNLYRKKVGADSSRWRDSLVRDLEGTTELTEVPTEGTAAAAGADLDALVALMGRCCSLWDRYQYLYVRLTDDEKTLVNGFDGMVEIMKRHPAVFTCGAEYFRRHDPSDPLLDVAEPQTGTGGENQNITHLCRQVDENPYLTPKELILVFHYVTTDESPVTAAHLMECSSPAMRSVLPPRLVTLLQMFPEYFSCKEITPGTFTIRKSTKKSTDDTDTLEGSALLSREETLNAVKDLIPARGVDIGQLQLWVSLQTKHAATHHFGGISELIEAHTELFYIVANPPYRTVFLKTKTPA